MNTLTSKSTPNNDAHFDGFLEKLNVRFKQNCGTKPLFKTNTINLFDVYLSGFPEESRQFHNCNACRKFINTYGDIVALDENGVITPAIWSIDDVDAMHKQAVSNVIDALSKAEVEVPFYSNEKILGQPITNGWKHLSVVNFKVNSGSTEGLRQLTAVMKERHKMIRTAFLKHGQALIEKAIVLAHSGVLDRQEETLFVLNWWNALHEKCKAHPKTKRNIWWLAAINATPGQAHLNSGCVGALLEDLCSSLSKDAVVSRHNARVRGDVYMHPVAPPSQSNVEQAEKLVQQLGIEKSLERRFAQLEEIPTFWKPTIEEKRSDSVFGHLLNKENEVEQVNDSPITMTFKKFESILPTVTKMEVYITPRPQAFIAFVTASHSDAPPIIAWDTLEKRNPFSVYLHYQGGLPNNWGLSANSWHRVTAVTSRPHRWNKPESNQTAIFIIENCVDILENGNALFPENLRSELHGVRRTIEAYSKDAVISNRENASVCGLEVNQHNGALLKVYIGNQSFIYNIDRFD